MLGWRLFLSFTMILIASSPALAVVRLKKSDFPMYEFLLSPNMYAGQDPAKVAGAAVSRMVVDPGSDPTNAATPDKVYVPIWQYGTATWVTPKKLPGGTTADNGKSSILLNLPCSGTLQTEGEPSTSCTGEPFLAIDIYNDEPNVTRNLFVAHKELTGTWTTMYVSANLGGPYVLGSSAGQTINSGILNSRTYYIRLRDSDTGINTSFVAGTNYTGFESKTLLYVFMNGSASSTSGATVPSSFTDPSAYPGGTYIELNMSDRIPINPSTSVGTPITAVSLTGPAIKGDTQATALYSSSTTNLTGGAFKTIGIATTTTPLTGPTTYRQQGSVTNDTIAGLASTSVVPSLPSGAVKISRLSNGTTYAVSVAQMNKYQFISEFPSSNGTVTPEEIPSFIRTQGCFLISAGFKRPHYVLSYFTSLRDNYLKQHAWGRSFIDWYYQTAPQYAMDVYNSSTLSWAVRSMAYVLYGLMVYFKEILAVLLVLGLGISFHRKRQS